jgi:Polysaccharide lyase
MKTNKIFPSGVMMLFFFLSFSFLSCQKELLPVTDEAVVVENSTSARISALATTTTTRKNLVFNFTSEASNSLTATYCTSPNYWCSFQGYASYSFQRSTAYVRSGSYSIRYELRKTDGDVFRSKRAESNRATSSEPVGKCERWYGASYYLPSDYVTDPAAESLTQWYPGLSLWTVNGEWRMVQFGDNANQSRSLGMYERNKWTDFVFHIKWTTASDGLIEVWKNGTKIVSKTGATIKSGTTVYCPYFKTGIYKWPWKSTGGAASITTKRVAYIDDIREGNSLATYADVAPGP